MAIGLRLLRLLACCLLAAGPLSYRSALADDPGGPIKIGLLVDMSGPLSLETGRGDELGARMAIEEIGGTLLGRPVVLLTADHQNKPDVGLTIAREWVDRNGVRVITGLDNSAIALATHSLTREHDFISLVAGAGTSDLTGKACSSRGFHWTHDSYSNASSIVTAAAGTGADRWFFLTADYAFGIAQERDMSELVRKRGGTILGSIRFPQGNADFSSFLLQAKASGAENIGLATSSNDLANLLKSAGEFQMLNGKQQFFAPIVAPSVIASTGLGTVRGLITVLSYFPGLNPETLDFGRRFAARYNGQMPGATNEGVYSALHHYFRAVQAAGTIDPDTVAAKMRELPVTDIVNKNARVRSDGRLMNDRYVVVIKSPEESLSPGDFFKLLRTIPANEAYRPLAEGGCVLPR